MTISAKIIADSYSEAGNRITTLQLRYPRFIHAEFMTHRAFSRNASSSRAIPVERMIKDVLEDTAMPIHWGANQKGMQAENENDSCVVLGSPQPYTLTQNYGREEAWRLARDSAIYYARGFSEAGYHKQIVNRLLEPFMHINVLVTATEWANFFALRDHPAAQPEIRELAIQIRNAMADSVPTLLNGNEWHLPYVTAKEKLAAAESGKFETAAQMYESLIPLSVARCASVSYLTVEGEPMTAEKAQEIYTKLLGANPIHASPAEHQAKPDQWFDGYWLFSEHHGNFNGWIQYRKTLENECVYNED